MLINNAVLTGSFIVNGVNYITNTPSTGSNTFVGTQTISGSTLMTGSLGVTGSVSVSGSITATGTLTAQTLVVQTITSSIVYSSGSNIFGNQLTDVQQMTGSLRVTGSLSLNNIAIPTSASLASTYLPLAGGTLTGALSGTSATFSGVLTFANGVTNNIGSDKFFLGSGGYNYLYCRSTGLQILNQADTTALVTILNGGNVGIGTTSPSGAAGLALVLNSGASQGRICIKTSGTGDASGDGLQIGMDSTSAFIEQRENADLTFATNASERIRITSGGKVGITSSVAADVLLNVVNSSSTGYGMNISAGSGGGTYALRVESYNGGSEFFRIKGDGIVIIPSGYLGTSYYAMNYTSTNGSSREWRIGSDQTAFGAFSIAQATTQGGSTFSDKIVISSGGEVSINNTSTTGRFNIYESTAKWAQIINHGRAGVQYMIQFTYNDSEVGAITSNNSNTTYATSSDYRLKKDLKNFNGLDLVSKLSVYDFAWKVDSTKRMYGVLAHEMAEVLPYAVNKEKDLVKEDGKIDPQGVDYSLITPLLVKAIQEQQSIITSLQERLTALENK